MEPVVETVHSGRLGGFHAADRLRAYPAAGRLHLHMDIATAVRPGWAPCGAQPREGDGEFEAWHGRLVIARG